MPRIRLLPDSVINRIAAGEVVERPASVVKELVENSLDAGATSVTVSLEEGGLSRIEVSDDGMGMDRDDALLALERHATSKLDEQARLDAITTLGFRGEALPSIAAVSRLLLETAPEDGEGTRVECDFGRLVEVRPTSRPRGTRLEVRNLFQRLPARRKFLRSRDTELRHAVTLLTALALTRPQVTFLLHHNNRLLFHLPSAAELWTRLPDLLGPRRAQTATLVSLQQGQARVSGYLLSDRAGRQVTIAVNGRVVRDRLLSAVAHRTLRSSTGSLEADGFLHLEVPTATVDVNVHPTKAEVRFSDPRAVSDLLTHALADAMTRLRRPTVVRRLVTVGQPTAPTAPLPLPYPPAPPPPLTAETSPPPDPAAATPTPWGRLVGQYRSTYLILEDADGLVLIDQHAAHERVLYEELLAQNLATPLQPLLVPLVVELRPEQAALAAELAPQLASLGLELEPLSGAAVRLTAAPPALGPEALERVLPALLVDLESASVPGEGIRQRAAAALACRAAVKKNAALSPAEVHHLLARLARTSDPHRCPHGRPIALRLPHAEIERRIGRA